MRIGLLADSDVDRKNSNKDFEESGFKNLGEENCSSQHINNARICELALFLAVFYWCTIYLLYIYLARSR